MRDLAKSIGRFSWAMSLFGLEQLVKSTRPEQAAASFDAVTDRAREELDGWMRKGFEAGDEMQRGIVDATFGFASADPKQWTRTGSDVLQRSIEALRQVFPGGKGGKGGGWGPMPPTS